MLIYNITFHIEDSIHDEAIAFLKYEYIPLAVKSGILFNPRMCKVHSSHIESGKNYSIQFYVKNRQLLEDWKSSAGEELNQTIRRKFQDKALGFSTLLEELDLDRTNLSE